MRGFFVFNRHGIINFMKTGLFIGRFQPLHYGHLWMIQMIARQVDHLIIGLGSSNSAPSCKNPFTAPERIEMIKRGMKEIGVRGYSIVELPDFKSDEEWIKEMGKFSFDTAWSGNEWVQRVFKEHGLPIEVIKEFPGLSGTKIRRHIVTGQPWLKFIPLSVRKYLQEIKATTRVRTLCKRV